MRPSQNIVEEFLKVLFVGLQYERWQPVLEMLKRISIVLSVIFAFLFLFALIKVWPLRPRVRLFFRSKDVRKQIEVGKEKRKVRIKDSELKQRWLSILQKLDPKSHESLSLSVIAADKLVDDALKQIGFVGDTMADRLKQLSSADMKSLEHLWDAHKLRNELVHKPDFKLTSKNAKGALKAYEEFLKELQLLE